MNPAPLPLSCLEGRATLFPGPVYGGKLRALILTGQRKRPDSLRWSLLGERKGVAMAVSIQGLYRGRYCDAVVSAGELHRGLLALGATDEAASLSRACAANSVFLVDDRPGA